MTTGFRTPDNLKRYARFKHDIVVFGEPRAFPRDLSATPETVPVFSGSVDENGKFRVGGKGDIWLPGIWQDYLAAINSERGKDFALTPKAGWLNTNKKADTLGFGGNLVEVKRIAGDYAELGCFIVDDPPPDPELANYQNGDPRIQKWTVVKRGGNIMNPGKGIDVYSFLIGRSSLWIHLSRLELFPDLPLQVRVSPLAWRGLYVRSLPDVKKGKVIGVVGPWSFSHPVTLLEYAPRASSVWAKARLADGKEGYIAILWHPDASQLKYYTSWKMITTPPIPPNPEAQKPR